MKVIVRPIATACLMAALAIGAGVAHADPIQCH